MWTLEYKLDLIDIDYQIDFNILLFWEVLVLHIIGAGPAGISLAYYSMLSGAEEIALYEQSNQIGGNILTEYTAQLVEIGSSSGERLSEYASSPTILGGPVQTVFTLFILVFQLAIVWTKKK